MTTIQLRNSLQKEIGDIKDVKILKAVKAFLASIKDDNEPFRLSDAQRESIRISEEQIKKGEYKSSRQVFKDARKWLKSK